MRPSFCTIGVCVYRRLLASPIVKLDRRTRSIWKLSIECFPILDTAPQELRPGRDGDILRNWFRKQTPELRMVPTQIVAAAVAMGSNAVPQPHHFGNQFLSTPAQNVRVHSNTTPMCFHWFSARSTSKWQ